MERNNVVGWLILMGGIMFFMAVFIYGNYRLLQKHEQRIQQLESERR